MSLGPFEQFSGIEDRWGEILSSPLWYLTIIPEIQDLTEKLKNEAPGVQDVWKARLYDFFERHLRAGDIRLGTESGVMDTERKEIDTIVIHHTSNPPGLRLDRLSAIELMRLYGPYFEKPTFDEDKHLKGQPIYSGHVRCGKQVFWPYHWIIRRDGHTDRLLFDSEVGWHAGNWEANCRSIAIALDNDYELDRPSRAELEAIANLVRDRYSNIPITRILGHREVNSRTICPSQLFLNTPEVTGWKEDLISLIR